MRLLGQRERALDGLVQVGVRRRVLACCVADPSNVDGNPTSGCPASGSESNYSLLRGTSLSPPVRVAL